MDSHSLNDTTLAEFLNEKLNTDVFDDRDLTFFTVTPPEIDSIVSDSIEEQLYNDLIKHIPTRYRKFFVNLSGPVFLSFLSRLKSKS